MEGVLAMGARATRRWVRASTGVLLLCLLGALPIACSGANERCVGSRACTNTRCDASLGCAFSTGCDGLNPRCRGKIKDACAADDLCSWTILCQGEPPPCSGYDNDECESQYGCKLERRPLFN
jgi:hypothetical protein